jgi:hypothetical protein
MKIEKKDNKNASEVLTSTIFNKEESRGLILITKLEFGSSFGMSLERVCQYHSKLIPNLEVTQNSLKKAPN